MSDLEIRNLHVQINGKEIPIGANYKEFLLKMVFKMNS